ncbi:hypothetical protein chiPu_0015085 [Chiloscyllium punctatum]|uniref:Uncharacterized protein n=1 Tax=Chiloscyllium punctatum TaxID=137246 RepID=A0A401T1S8_CHIPU|nr:hypothetical protein [Chiloscyllium punctatum]
MPSAQDSAPARTKYACSSVRAQGIVDRPFVRRCTRSRRRTSSGHLQLPYPRQQKIFERKTLQIRISNQISHQNLTDPLSAAVTVYH